MGGFQVGEELGEVALVFRDADEASDSVTLSSAAAAAFHRDALQFAAHCLHGSCAIGQPAKIDFQRPCSIQAAQGAQAIARARQ